MTQKLTESGVDAAKGRKGEGKGGVPPPTQRKLHAQSMVDQDTTNHSTVAGLRARDGGLVGDEAGKIPGTTMA